MRYALVFVIIACNSQGKPPTTPQPAQVAEAQPTPERRLKRLERTTGPTCGRAILVAEHPEEGRIAVVVEVCAMTPQTCELIVDNFLEGADEAGAQTARTPCLPVEQ